MSLWYMYQYIIGSGKMTLRAAGLETKKRILSVCVRLFLEQGYKSTTVRQIVAEADTSISAFQNIFHSKDGVLLDLVGSMFGGQFGAARSITGDALPPIYTYAVETAIQLTLTELNENLREIYIEAYSQPNIAEYIYLNTTAELKAIFGANFPGYTDSDFYEMDIGSSGLMRNYMAKKCDIHFPLKRKLERFLTASLRIYKVPEAQLQGVLTFIGQLDVVSIANGVIQKLFAMLEMKYSFTLSQNQSG